MTNEEMREKVLADAMTELKEKAGSVIDGIMGSLYTDYLPHVVSDTESNISYRVEGCLKSMMAGDYTRSESGGTHVWVGDGYGNNHMISLASYSKALKPLCDLMGETIINTRIAQLEKEVESLRNQLKDAWRMR
jgi:hypothetical protein